MVRTIYAARSPDDLPRFQHQYGPPTDDDLRASASNANPALLPYHRLIIHKSNNNADILPAFALDHTAACPRCHPDPVHSPQQLDLDQISYATQDDVTIKSLVQKSYAQLHAMPFPEFWIALAACIAPAYPSIAPSSYALRSKSESKPQPPPSSANLSSSQTHPSSPPPPRSSSPYTADYELDEDAFAALRTVSETLTNQLAYMTDRYALFCLRQDDHDSEFRARLDSQRYTAQLGHTTVTSCDDGGLAKWDRQPTAWVPVDSSVTIRESKIAPYRFTYDGPDTHDITPVIGNDILTQYLLEVITASRANHRPQQSRIVLVVQCSVFSAFLFFQVGPQFHAWQDAQCLADRQRLIATHPKDTCIEMTSTRWFCLLTPHDRALRFCNTYSSMRMYDHDDTQSDGNDGNDGNDNHSATSQALPTLPITTPTTETNRKRKAPRSSSDSFVPSPP